MIEDEETTRPLGLFGGSLQFSQGHMGLFPLSFYFPFLFRHVQTTKSLKYLLILLAPTHSFNLIMSPSKPLYLPMITKRQQIQFAYYMLAKITYSSLNLVIMYKPKILT